MRGLFVAQPRFRTMAFQPGQSGNPGGRPKVDAKVREMARAHTEEAIAALVSALQDPKTAVSAATALLDRGYGKPAQSMTLSGDEDAPLVTRIERVIVNATNPNGSGI